MSKRILIIRNFASKVNVNSYNLQEIGLGKALVRKGFDCDVVYYHDTDTFNEVIYEVEGKKLTIKWTKAIKFMSNSIYYSLLKKSILDQYDIVISTEYHQVMTFLLSILCGEKLYLYHGPYQDNSKNLIQQIYDKVLTPIIRNRVNKVFTKSDLANDYLKNKGFKDIETIGVGLDIEKLEVETESTIVELKSSIDFNKKNLLYVGVLEDRRNIEFLFNVFAKLIKKDSNINLVLVGNGKTEDTERYFKLANYLNIEQHIVHIKQLEQSDLKSLYKKMDLFIFPTNYDIFGMVLLESMYFKLPVVSTYNGGSQTLIKSGNGVVLRDLDENLWVDKIYSILMDKSLKDRIGENAHKQIINNFTWDKVANKII